MYIQDQITKQARALTELLSIKHPIIAAPMLGVTTPEMVAAVSNAGALGSLPCGMMSGEEIEKAIARVRELTDKPFAVNLRVEPRVYPTQESIETVFNALEPLRDELGAEHKVYEVPSFEEQFDAVHAAHVPCVSFSFGGPREEFAEALEKQGVVMIGAVSCTREAKVQRIAGCQVLVAQGWEAGGPRQYFENNYEQTQIGLMALLQPVLRVASPSLVVAAGAMMNGRAMASAMLMGASGVQIGSLLLRSHESALLPEAKQQITWADDACTRVIDRMSGRPTRVYETGLSVALNDAQLPTSTYPGQWSALHSITEAAYRQGRVDLLELPLGQAAQLAPAKSAGEIVSDLVAEYEQILGE